MASVARESVPGPETAVSVAVASRSKLHGLCLRMICGFSGFSLYEASSCREAVALAGRHHLRVVVCEWDLPGGGWKTLLEGLADLPQRPRLIVSSSVTRPSLREEVVRLGGYDVVTEPFDVQEVSRTISAAHDAAARRQEGPTAMACATAGDSTARLRRW